MVVRFLLGPFRRKPGPERRAGNASDSKAADAQGATLVGLPRQTALEETDKHNACPLITSKNGSDNAATTKVWRSAGNCVPFFGFRGWNISLFRKCFRTTARLRPAGSRRQTHSVTCTRIFCTVTTS